MQWTTHLLQQDIQKGRIILLKNESSLNRLKIAFSAYYSQQKVNRRENKRETDEKTSVYEHYEHIKT